MLPHDLPPGQIVYPTFRIEALMCDEYSSVKPYIPIAQELESGLVRLSQVDDDGPLLRDKQQMNPDKVREDPPCGWRLERFAFLVWKRGSMVLERGANAVFQGRLHQQTPRHDQEKCHHARRLFERQ
jgi:hypothetical protein